MSEWKERLSSYRNWIFAGIGLIQLVLLILLGSKGGVIRQNQEKDDQLDSYLLEHVSSGEAFPEAASEESGGKESALSPIWMVDIKGEVAFPGIYQVEQDMRIDDVVKMAGGLTEKANVRRINLAQVLQDQMMIYIPAEGEEETEESQEITHVQTPQEEQKQGDKININTASSTELQQLNGIGAKKAEKIIAYREENGLFKQAEELMNVNGIGEKTFEALKDQVVVSEE